MMSRQERRKRRSQVLGKVAMDWASTLGDVEPDPQYMHNDPSQYPETAEFLSAPVEDQDRLFQEGLIALREAGLANPIELRRLDDAGL